MKRIVFTQFNMGDVEDPEIYAAQPLCEFMETDKGQWVRANCNDPMYKIERDPNMFGYRIYVYGDVEDKHATEFYLKWN